MKKTKIKALALICVGVFTLIWGISHAGTTGVVDSGHDLSYLGPSGFQMESGQVCVFCHTPHGANPNMKSGTYWDEGVKDYVQSGAPILLWNRALLANTSQSFKMYTSSSMADPNNKLVGAYSLMCMSCHDGISAINVLTHIPGDALDESPADGYVDSFLGGPTQIGDDALFGATPLPINIGERLVGSDPGYSDLRNDHPITIDYSAAKASDGAGLHPISVSGSTYYVSDAKIRLFPHPNGLGTDSVECPTCHDVHNEGDPNAGTYPFLAVTKNSSYMCFQCHNK